MSTLEPKSGGRNLLVDEVYAAIKDAIQTMTLAPGVALVESRLAAQLNVSKTPIREALGRLAQEGLTEAAAFRGYRVTKFTGADVRSIMELRSVLEGLAARRACKAMPEEALELLARTTSLAEQERERENWSSVSILVHQVHNLIHENCGDARLTTMIGVLDGQFERARFAMPVTSFRLVKSVQEHSLLSLAIQTRNGHLAESIMRDHLVALIDKIDLDAALRQTDIKRTSLAEIARNRPLSKSGQTGVC
ncbi:GntR family transcriptional regulator [Amycolatopsis ultiminotia]|uniref:GntR family transcriptional regulator n=1 Tax=Amycolatopsis ultiminotia TaxID=543629 RepID=A0ABP6V884_9PSEU